MDRRDFLRRSAAGCAGTLLAPSLFGQAPPADGRIMTVLGPIAPADLGSTLMHEHVLVDFVGADKIEPGRYDANEAFTIALPYLLDARDVGCRGFVECTPAYLGRDPRLLARLAKAAGLHILTNTGYYGAAKDQYVPRHAFDATADELADRWTREWSDGIEGTSIRPGFIKIGVDSGALSPTDRKLVQAAARTHLRTGLVIASHTGDTRAAHDQFAILDQEGVRPEAFIWVHAQNDWDLDTRADAAERGAWIELDNIAERTVESCAERVTALKARGRLNRLLVSHDAGWYRPGERRGGAFRGFQTLYTAFVPALRASGWTPDEVARLLVTNPAAALALGTRAAPSGVRTERRLES